MEMLVLYNGSFYAGFTGVVVLPSSHVAAPWLLVVGVKRSWYL